MSRVKKEIGEQGVWKCHRLIYGPDEKALRTGAEPRWTVEFDVFAVQVGSEESPEWKMPLGYPTAGVSVDGIIKPARWTAESLIEALQRTLRMIRGTYGGEWFLSVEKHDDQEDVYDRNLGRLAEAKERILAGPDSPGRRFLVEQGKNASLTPVMKQVPVLERPRTVASREMLDRMMVPTPTTGPVGPTPFEPDKDPALQDEYTGSQPAGREPGAEG